MGESKREREREKERKRRNIWVNYFLWRTIIKMIRFNELREYAKEVERMDIFFVQLKDKKGQRILCFFLEICKIFI